MHDDASSFWLTGAEPAWSGHHAALAARLAHPAAARLTEEQEAIALGLAQRLVLGLATALPLAGEPADIWGRWESTGLPGSSVLAPALLARVEEFRWRRNLPLAPAEPAAPLFQHQPRASDPDPAGPLAASEPDVAEAAYLRLRIADGARTTAIGQPLLLPTELSPAPLRALLLDIAAQDLALVGDGAGRAADMAHAIDALLGATGAGSIDDAARRYCAALHDSGTLAEAATGAVARRDWLAVVALLTARSGGGFSRVAAGLLAARDDQIVSALATIAVETAAAGPLLDALADVPGRPGRHGTALPSDQHCDTMAAVEARAAHLRDRGA